MTTKTNGEQGKRILNDQKLTLTQIQELFQENLKFGWQKNVVTLTKKNEPLLILWCACLTQSPSTNLVSFVLSDVDGSSTNSYVYFQGIKVFAHLKVPNLVIQGQGYK